MTSDIRGIYYDTISHRRVSALPRFFPPPLRCLLLKIPLCLNQAICLLHLSPNLKLRMLSTWLSLLCRTNLRSSKEKVLWAPSSSFGTSILPRFVLNFASRNWKYLLCHQTKLRSRMRMLNSASDLKLRKPRSIGVNALKSLIPKMELPTLFVSTATGSASIPTPMLTSLLAVSRNISLYASHTKSTKNPKMARLICLRISFVDIVNSRQWWMIAFVKVFCKSLLSAIWAFVKQKIQHCRGCSRRLGQLVPFLLANP